MRLYKGASPGSYWALNDARLNGFTAAPLVSDPARIIQHIIAFSYPSPYNSFSASYAVASAYASAGKTGIASALNPGYVYEIETTLPAAGGVAIVDPARAILEANPTIGSNAMGLLPTQHDGEPNLIAGIALRVGVIINAVPRRQGSAAPRPAVAQDALWAVVFALRDAEVLVGSLPTQAVIQRWPFP